MNQRTVAALDPSATTTRVITATIRNDPTNKRTRNENVSSSKVKWGKSCRAYCRIDNDPQPCVCIVDNTTDDNSTRKERRNRAKDRNTICFGCRQKGHSVENCKESKQTVQGICYNCGSTEHSLKHCKKPRKGSKCIHTYTHTHTLIGDTHYLL